MLVVMMIVSGHSLTVNITPQYVMECCPRRYDIMTN